MAPRGYGRAMVGSATRPVAHYADQAEAFAAETLRTVSWTGPPLRRKRQRAPPRSHTVRAERAKHSAAAPRRAQTIDTRAANHSPPQKGAH